MKYLYTLLLGLRDDLEASEDKEVPQHIVDLNTGLTETVIADMEKRVGKLMADDCIGADGYPTYPSALSVLPLFQIGISV